ncbi:16S rRNA (guanine(1207)-N(2))-methyltransferase RsmC [Aestuariibacter halophilus]|uniref:Ribosomal RNA small subunit methyltransferase C n=1 Tax=Fluctibacter halophilus TaxID=226011 RepID=A0ABS8GAP8_9ALTE|nr:16S rRNA (guanine(1207)-N(2))-methyltransferase RsmC [Aestuariibacter halophilus]MCC2617665.1 16S rRNA (guanine(1207)-N(2))-methyltransferase RsmC [Aestuariibacter halophilus]
MSAPQTQVLLRNDDAFAKGRWLIANPVDGDLFSILPNDDLWGFHQYYDEYQRCIATHPAERHTFTAAYTTDTPFDGAVMYLPKAKAHARMLLANLASVVKPGGQLWIVGENKGGIKSAAKLLDDHCDVVNKVDSARHCSLFIGVRNDGQSPFELDEHLQRTTHIINDIPVTVCSLPGVFSHGELDPATALLLTETRQVPKGTLLDFACGNGVIACYLGLRQPQATLMLCDVSALALYCAKQSLAANDLEATVIASNGLAQVSGKFNGIFTNPPFHTGIKTDYGITHALIRDVRQHLQPKGSLVMVANRFLPYPDALDKTFGQHQVLAKTNKFTVYRTQA